MSSEDQIDQAADAIGTAIYDFVEANESPVNEQITSGEPPDDGSVGGP